MWLIVSTLVVYLVTAAAVFGLQLVAGRHRRVRLPSPRNP